MDRIFESRLVHDDAGIRHGNSLRRHLDVLVLHAERSLRNGGRVGVLVDLNTLANDRDFRRRMQLLYLAPIHGDVAKNIALELHRGAAGADEVSNQFVAV